VGLPRLETEKPDRPGVASPRHGLGGRRWFVAFLLPAETAGTSRTIGRMTSDRWYRPRNHELD
jgi:hypothetical protein